MVWEWLLPGAPEGERLTESRDIAFAAAACTNAAARSNCCEHEVQRGDWLYDICRRHNVDLRSLMIANPTLRNPNSLVVGSRIKIPGGRLSPAPILQSSPAGDVPVVVQATKRKSLAVSSSSPKAGSSPRRGPEIFPLSKALALLGQLLGKQHREYEVEQGDSLEWLAEKFGTSVRSIKRMNKLQDDLICTGSVLKIERSIAFEQQNLLGRKASVHERAASELGYRIDSSMKTFVSISPMFRVYVHLQKSKKQKALTPKTVKVQYGDTLADIASTHGLSIRELQRLNHLRNDVIFEGDVLAVNSGPSSMELVELRPGCRRTNRPLFSRHIHGALGIGGPQPPPRTKSIMGGARGEGRWKRKKKGFQLQEKWMRFKSPVTAGFVSSPYGWRWGAFHEGVDLAADQGTPILASDKGTVTFAGWSGGYGYLIAIQHEGGFVTRYGHCCAIHARVGQQVSRGQHVAAVGSTGHATGPHLHFEVRRNGEALDPFKWVKL